MNIIEQTRNLPPRACPTDFTFAYALIDELKHMPTTSKVYFPTPNKGVVLASIDCRLCYTSSDKPVCELSFSSAGLALQMAHTAVVSYTVKDGALFYHLEIRPNRRLRSNKHKSITSLHPDARSVALAIGANYMRGSVGRRIIAQEEKQAA